MGFPSGLSLVWVQRVRASRRGAVGETDRVERKPEPWWEITRVLDLCAEGPRGHLPPHKATGAWVQPEVEGGAVPWVLCGAGSGTEPWALSCGPRARAPRSFACPLGPAAHHRLACLPRQAPNHRALARLPSGLPHAPRYSPAPPSPLTALRPFSAQCPRWWLWAPSSASPPGGLSAYSPPSQNPEGAAGDDEGWRE